MRGIAAHRPVKETADRGVERIAVARRDQGRADRAWNDGVSPRSIPGSSVARYSANAAIPTTTAASRGVSAHRRRQPSALGGDERADLRERPGVHDVAALDPAAPRRRDAELHLKIEQLGAVAVAVDRHRGAGGDRPPRERAVEIEVRRRPVDLDDRAGLDRHLEERVVVEIVAGLVRHEPVGRMRDQRRRADAASRRRSAAAAGRPSCPARS